MKNKSFLCSAFALIFSCVLFVGSASATPPDRPIEIKVIEEQQVPNLKLKEKDFYLPVQIKVSEGVQNPQITTEVIKIEPLSRKVLKKETVSFSKRQTSRSVRIPTINEKGVYRVEVIAGDSKGAIYDRVILYQVVDEKGTRLYTQKQWHDVRTREHERIFQKTNSVRDFSEKLQKVSPEDAKRIIVDPKNKMQIMIQSDNDPGKDKKFVKDSSKDAWRAEDPITVRGRLVFTDFEGTVRPMVNVGVYLYDDDSTSGDDFLGSVCTNWNGEFSFSVNNDDGFLQNGRDIYFKVKLRNTRFRVRNGGNDYEWASDVHDDLSDGTVLDFGTLTPIGDHEPIQIFNFINTGWNHITVASGRDPGYVEIQYPGSSDFYNGTVNISASSNTAPDIVLHEYGHFLMDAAYPGGDPSPGGSHGFGSATQDQRLSWSEGWATAFMLSVCNDGQFNWDEGNTEGAGEWPSCTVQNDPGGQSIEFYSNASNTQGELQEGRVAAALLDFFDTNNDNNGGDTARGRNGKDDSNSSNIVPLSVIYNDVMWGSGHTDFLQYWTSLAGELSGQTLTDASEIMQYNWMSLPVSIDCVASKVAAAEIRNYDDTLKGLRKFRDQALKPTVDGRRIIQTYYRHSPEVAMLLIANPETRKEAAKIVSHFAMMGQASVNNRQLKDLMARNQQFIPADIQKVLDSVFELISAKGSKELNADMPFVKEQINKFAKLSLQQAINEGEKLQRVDRNDVKLSVQQHNLAPASVKADWSLIRKNLNKSQKMSEDSIIVKPIKDRTINVKPVITK